VSVRRDQISDGEPVSLADALAEVRAELGLPSTDVVTTLDARWVDVVGEDVAAHAKAVSLRDGVLTIAVDSPPWAAQLRYLTTALVERANALLSVDAVRSIALRVRPEGA
jgi:predicted nucleic acid-binding Zn ribbon protein